MTTQQEEERMAELFAIAKKLKQRERSSARRVVDSHWPLFVVILAFGVVIALLLWAFGEGTYNLGPPVFWW